MRPTSPETLMPLNIAVPLWATTILDFNLNQMAVKDLDWETATEVKPLQ